MAIKLYRSNSGPIVEQDGVYYSLPEQDWDALICQDDLASFLANAIADLTPSTAPDEVTAPVSGQEIWAAGVTYYRSRSARMEESQDAGGGDFYSRVYDADRPELFMKATPARTVGPGADVRIRKDSQWNVPEPELCLCINPAGRIIGYTVGNDMSSRDIEGENPLYLPQAKTYDGCCAVGPCILVQNEPLTAETIINLRIERDGQVAFEGETTLAQMKRSPEELVGFLFRECSFANGAFLMTGTGIVPPNEFTLHIGDVVHITITGIGTLSNTVAQ